MDHRQKTPPNNGPERRGRGQSPKPGQRGRPSLDEHGNPRDRDAINRKILKTIAEKEEQRGALLRSWRAKFDKIKELKAAQDKEKELETRLHMNGGISDETFWASSEARAEKIAEAANEAQKDLDLASELREEIEKLRSDLEKGTN